MREEWGKETYSEILVAVEGHYCNHLVLVADC